MKRLFVVCAIFFTGVIFGLISVHGTFNHLRHVFSPSLSFADGSTYVGGLNANGQLEGNGRLQWKNGDIYIGSFVAGVFEGEGKFSSVTGVYTGTFVKGASEGQGDFVYPDGSHYSGEFKSNRFHGKGKFIYSDGSHYLGDFVNGHPNGKGQWVFADKSVYSGDVVNGALTGKGELIRIDGKYQGDFVDGKMHGKGVYTDQFGSIYSGSFVKDIFEGDGVYKSAEGDISTGQFKDWVLNGSGMMTDSDGNQWQGEFKNGVLEGQGTFIEKQGEQYTGQFKFGKYSGKGKLIAANGDIYDGEFSFGSKHGAGTLTYKEPIDGIRKITGRWNYNRLVDGGSDVKIFSAEEITEHALYKESVLLQQALESVQNSDPQKIELYSLVVAGDGTEEVFRRESKFIETLFSSQYGNQPTSVYLSNSQRSLNEKPMATRTSVAAAINHIAERMDKTQDIFFLYITSHGSKNKTISLNHNGLALADIDAKWLGDLLKSTAIQNRVILLSACFSGGFVDDIKDENTLVMTAASAEKTSFGCADDSLFTYFGKAYFKESLKPGVDFEKAFYQARELVETWEADQKISPSEPQIYANEKVTRHVKQWLDSAELPVLTNLEAQSPQ